MTSRREVRHRRVEELISDFDDCLRVFEDNVPFTRFGQWEHHLATIRMLRELGSVGAALDDGRFVDSLWKTLRAWGIGIRGSHLAERGAFGDELRRWRAELVALEELQLAAAPARTRSEVWALVQGLAITENIARLVALTKTLHHLLPDLVVPIDRAYTGAFFAWHVPEFQTSQRRIFDVAWDAFARIAAATDPQRHVDERWNTSATKVIDNAIIGYCIAEDLTASQTRVGDQSTTTSGGPRRSSWSLKELQADLAAFERVLRDARLAENSIQTYVGRAETFLRWLEGRYEPRGPNA